MLKNRIFRLLSVFCSIVILMSCLTFSTVVADEPVGKMAAVYAYVLITICTLTVQCTPKTQVILFQFRRTIYLTALCTVI